MWISWRPQPTPCSAEPRSFRSFPSHTSVFLSVIIPGKAERRGRSAEENLHASNIFSRSGSLWSRMCGVWVQTGDLHVGLSPVAVSCLWASRTSISESRTLGRVPRRRRAELECWTRPTRRDPRAGTSATPRLGMDHAPRRRVGTRRGAGG